MEVDDVAFSTIGVGLGGGRPSVSADEGSIDVVEHISPHFANPCVKGLNLSNQQREVEESNALWTSVRAFTEEYFRGFVVLIKNIRTHSPKQKKRLTCRRVGSSPNAIGVVSDVVPWDIICNCPALLLGPLCKGVGPTLAHSAGLGGLQTPSGTSATHTIGDAVSSRVQ